MVVAALVVSDGCFVYSIILLLSNWNPPSHSATIVGTMLPSIVSLSTNLSYHPWIVTQDNVNDTGYHLFIHPHRASLRTGVYPTHWSTAFEVSDLHHILALVIILCCSSLLRLFCLFNILSTLVNLNKEIFRVSILNWISLNIEVVFTTKKTVSFRGGDLARPDNEL